MLLPPVVGVVWTKLGRGIKLKMGLDKLTNVIIPPRLTQTPGPDINQTREKSENYILC